jgi:hypothetical protein
VALLKARMSELGINASSPGDLLAKAKEIVLRHKELQAKASKLQAQVYLISCCFLMIHCVCVCLFFFWHVAQKMFNL